jgi:hypothetical protein
MINASSFGQVQFTRLDLFVHVHIEKNGIAFVVDNYQPIREQYYAQRYPQQNLQWKEDSDVQNPAIENQ